MKRVIKATTGRSTSDEYIKKTLFEHLADYDYLEIDGEPANNIVDRIAALSPYYDVDDVLFLSVDEQLSIPKAIKQFEDELTNS